MPNTVRAHAAYAMNRYFQAMGRNGYDCEFEGTGATTAVDPSKKFNANNFQFGFIIVIINN